MPNRNYHYPTTPIYQQAQSLEVLDMWQDIELNSTAISFSNFSRLRRLRVSVALPMLNPKDSHSLSLQEVLPRSLEVLQIASPRGLRARFGEPHSLVMAYPSSVTQEMYRNYALCDALGRFAAVCSSTHPKLSLIVFEGSPIYLIAGGKDLRSLFRHIGVQLRACSNHDPYADLPDCKFI